MKIIKIEPFILSHKLDKSFYFSQWHYGERKICVVKISTDEGLYGWGEGYGPAEVLYAVIRFLEPLILGKDPMNTEGLWHEMYRRSMDYARRGIMVAGISAIDIALWDLKGKILNQPVSVLLGGRKREKVQAYATGMYFSDTKDLANQLADEAVQYKEQGFEAMKMKVGLSIREDIRNVREVRNAIGDDIRLMVDANHAYSLNEAATLAKAMEEFDISWFEEPVSPDHYDLYKELRSKTSIPVAAGECEYLRTGFHQLFRNQCVDIAQPDICAAGGITEVKKIVTLAQTYGVDFVPHSWGTGIALSAALQLLSNLDIIPGRLKAPNAFMEYDRTENELRDNLVHPSITAVDGMVNVPDTPGLGITIDDDMIEHYAIKPQINAIRI
jgi:D-galactarolactone cycloisomerase